MQRICCILAISLSLTSLAGASMMGGMGHHTAVSEANEVSHEHHTSGATSAKVSDHGMMNMYDIDSDSGEMVMCNMCVLCTSIIPSIPTGLLQHHPLLVWDFPEPNSFFSSLNYSLDKPPRS